MVSCVQIQLLNGCKSRKQHGSSHNTMLLALNTCRPSVATNIFIYIIILYLSSGLSMFETIKKSKA
jgi:hypothetical protein